MKNINIHIKAFISVSLVVVIFGLFPFLIEYDPVIGFIYALSIMAISFVYILYRLFYEMYKEYEE